MSLCNRSIKQGNVTSLNILSIILRDGVDALLWGVFFSRIELHAHINGSISPATIDKLIVMKKQRSPSWCPPSDCDTTLSKGRKRTMEECFQVFALLHQLVDCEEAAYMVTIDVIREFALLDNVKYIELRTTPRDVCETGMTKSSYVASVLQAIQDSHADKSLDIIVRLLLAIDRKVSVDEAMETVILADHLRTESQGLVIGIDLSGNPFLDGTKFIPCLIQAKEKHLKLALHIAEVAGTNEENSALLALRPDRIGHGCFLHPDMGGTERLVKDVEEMSIPLELCLTSNLKSGTVKTIEDHHFAFWREKKHPLIICTDDKGIFSTSLTEEFSIASQTFGISIPQLWQLSYNSIDHIFEGDSIKAQLRAAWKTLLPLQMGGIL